MPEDNDGLADFSHRLSLNRPARPPRVETLRTSGIRSAAAATAASAATSFATPKVSTDNDIPGVVFFIGLYEFGRAITLAVVYGMMLRYPSLQIESHTFLTTFFVLSNGALHVSPLLPITIGYALAEGVCLWMRVNWGRRVLIATSIWAVIRLASFLFQFQVITQNATDAQMAQVGFVRDAAMMLAAVNVIIGAYLAFAPGVAEAFGQEK